MKKVIFLFALLFILIIGALVSQNYFKTGQSPFGQKPTATINNQTFKLLIAKTPEEKEIGLSKRGALPKDQGMLFLFDSLDYYPFWARDMRFAFDIIFIDKDRIVTIYQNIEPQKDQDKLRIIRPKSPANRVLEINANLSSKYKFKEGDLVKIQNLP